MTPPPTDDLGWECVGRRTLLEHPLLRLERQDLVSPRTGQTSAFFVFHSPDWVNVVAITERDEVVLIRQMRAGVAGPSTEIPGGVVEAGEAPEAAARRELLEEAGFVTTELTSLGWVHPNPAIQTNRAHFFLARGHLGAAQALDDAEDITVELCPIAALPARLGPGGDITHSLVQVALARAGFTGSW